MEILIKYYNLPNKDSLIVFCLFFFSFNTAALTLSEPIPAQLCETAIMWNIQLKVKHNQMSLQAKYRERKHE